MQISEGRHRNPRGAKLHTSASNRIEHPCQDGDDHTGSCLNVNDLAICATFTVLASEPPSIKRVPTIKDFNFLPDMGRMTAGLPSRGRITCCSAPKPAAGAPPSSTACSKPPSSTASIRKPTSPTSSTVWRRDIQQIGSKSCSHGIGAGALTSRRHRHIETPAAKPLVTTSPAIGEIVDLDDPQ